MRVREGDRRAGGVILACALALAWPGRAEAAPPDAGAAVREAGKHFQRGVALYGEADYRGALVEFTRADALSPSATVLYNIGQTAFQLHDYARALSTFERYLATATPADAHRAEVENDVHVLRTRVGRLRITTIPPGAEIAIDDQPAGTTPFQKPVTVNVGHLKLTASKAGQAPVTRYLDVAAEDDMEVSVALTDAPATGPADPLHLRQGKDLSPPAVGHSALRVVGWIATGAAAAGAVTMGILARRESLRLRDARDAYPTTSEDLDVLSRRTTTYAIVADALGATAVVLGVVTLLSGSSGSSERNVARLSIGPRSAVFETTF